MDKIWDLLVNEICWGYAASVFLLTYFTLSQVVINPKKWVKVTLSISFGVLLGTLWFYTMGAKTPTLLFSFLFQAVFYQWIVKEIFKMTGHTYNNKRGIFK